MRFHRDNTLAVLIDVQERLFPHINKHEEMARRIGIIIQGLKALNVPIMVTEQYVKGLGTTIPELNPYITDIERHEKMSFSCCGSESFLDELIHSKKKEIILFGIEAHVCVLQTFLDMQNRGLNVVVIEDCVSSRKQSDKEIAIHRMRQEGARISSSESILFELCKEAGSDTFKEISKLVK